MNPTIIAVAIGAYFLLKPRTASGSAAPPTNILNALGQALAQNTAAQKALLASQQKAAAASKGGGGSSGGSGSSSGLLPPTPIGSNPLSQWLSGIQQKATNTTESVTPIDTSSLGTLDTVATPDYSFTPDPLQSLLLQDQANYGTYAPDTIDTTFDLSGDTLDSVDVGTYTAPTMAWPDSTDTGSVDTIPSDTSSLGYIDSSTLGDSSFDSGDTVYNGDGIYIDPSMGDATGYQGWDYGEG